MRLVMRGRFRTPAFPSVIVDTATTHQTMQGFGTTTRVFGDPHVTNTSNGQTPAYAAATAIPDATAQGLIYDDLYLPSKLGLTMIRYVTDAGIEPSNGTFDFDTNLRLFVWQMDYVAAAEARASSLLVFGSPVAIESWMTYNDTTDQATWARRSIAEWKNRGRALDYWGCGNEPSGSAGGTMTGAQYRDIIKALGPMMATDGTTIPITATDDDEPQNADSTINTVMTDTTARSYVGSLSTHLYGNGTAAKYTNMSNVKAQAVTYGKPLWMTEWYTSDYLEMAKSMHECLVTYDFAAYMYLWGFFGAWTNDSSQLIDLNLSGATYTGYTKKKHYYVMQQWSKYVRPGMVRVNCTTGTALKVSAYTGGGYTTIVMLNDSGADIVVATGGTFGSFVDGQRTSATENGVSVSNASSYTVPNGGIVTLRYTA